MGHSLAMMAGEFQSNLWCEVLALFPRHDVIGVIVLRNVWKYTHDRPMWKSKQLKDLKIKSF